MGRSTVVAISVLVAMSWLGVETAFADTAGEPFQLALFNPIQIRDEHKSITGLRLNLIYGKNVSVTGLDIGIGNHCTGGLSQGLQYGIVGLNEGGFMGWQDNAINIVNGSLMGFQSGFYNHCGQGEGMQIGLVNRATAIRGFQIGLVNYTETMYGLQLGLLNIIRSKETLPIFVIANWSF
jgi:hypothetical protein